MKIWAHRGCSQRYPENTITSFSKALELFEKAKEAYFAAKEIGYTNIRTDYINIDEINKG